MNLALHNIRRDGFRFLLNVAGVALAVTAMLLFDSILRGTCARLGAYLSHVPGNMVIVGEGTRGFIMGPDAFVPDDAVWKAQHVEGVTAVVPILAEWVPVEMVSEVRSAYLIGYNPASGGGPWRLAAGREPASDSEIVLDRVLATRGGVRLGDKIRILDRSFRVAGFSEETTVSTTSFAFMRRKAAERLLDAPGRSTYVIVQPEGALGTDELFRRLGSPAGTKVLAKADLSANDAWYLGGFFRRPLRVMSVISAIVGILMIGLVSTSTTVERRREYGILKAIGARNRFLYRTVVAETVTAALVGLAAGIGLAVGTGQALIAVASQYLALYDPAMLAAAGVAALVMALCGAVLPIRVIAGLAPADAVRR